jgi:predicted nucleic acid-binding protein
LAVVVSDTSPIRALSHLARLELLALLFSEVVIPPAVVHELEHPRRRFEPIRVSSIPNSRIVTPTDPAAVSTLLAQLDIGEA